MQPKSIPNVKFPIPNFLVHSDHRYGFPFHRAIKTLITRASRVNSDGLSHLAGAYGLLNSVAFKLSTESRLSFVDFTDLTTKLDMAGKSLERFWYAQPDTNYIVLAKVRGMVKVARDSFLWTALDARSGSTFTLITH